MKVKELQERLRKLDPEFELVCYSEDEHLLAERRRFVIFDVLAVEKAEAERVRLDDGTPYLKFGKGPAAETVAYLQITTDF